MLENIKNDNDVSDYKSNLKIKKYNMFPTHTLIIVDPKTGRIYVYRALSL